MSKIKEVIKRNGNIVPFNPERIMNAIYRSAVSVGGRDKETAKDLADKVVVEMENRVQEGFKPNIEEVQDVVEKVLIENGHATVAKEYILYRQERKENRESNADQGSRTAVKIPWEKIWHVYDWTVEKDLNTFEKINKEIDNGNFADVVKVSEARYENDVDIAAELILQRADKLKMVFISGPSSSGKTTTTIKIEQRLKQKGLSFVTLNVDHYFFDLELHPKDEFGDYDFETPQALDLPLINDHLKKLGAGEEVLIPHYDFKKGLRTLNQTPVQIKDNEIILIDSLHGLYPQFSEGIDEEVKFKLYLEPLVQIKDADNKFVQWTDIRLMRRMLRDSVQRAYDPQQTLEHWHYVRASELRHIIPYSNNADFIISSGMPYELSLYRSLLFDKFGEWVKMFKDNPLKEDAFVRAERTYKMLKGIRPIEDNSAVPKDSVLREFIGGSEFEY
ncbi:MAG: ATP cone domain-containing protein [Melioribacteraceae bacterium]|jgi:uridine kinase|nr:ATP cone domain-containing protein [Melioribacteraceae bacterium]